MQCIDCGRFSLRTGDIDLARAGFGACALERDAGRYTAARYERQCESFARGANGERGRAWLEGRSGAPPPASV